MVRILASRAYCTKFLGCAEQYALYRALNALSRLRVAYEEDAMVRIEIQRADGTWKPMYGLTYRKRANGEAALKRLTTNTRFNVRLWPPRRVKP